MDNMINLWHAGTGALLGTIDHLTEIGFPASTGSDKPASLGVSRWSLRDGSLTDGGLMAASRSGSNIEILDKHN
uniref:Putative sugar transporter ERD6-like 13 n=1 Tax=Talaromyces marneffei PM1 TaxID=1077442 RepID=A0A093VKH8_TALMA